MVRVEIIESEAGWGQRVEETLEFPDEETAREYCCTYNNTYNQPKKQTPGWYMYARMEGQKEYGMIS